MNVAVRVQAAVVQAAIAVDLIAAAAPTVVENAVEIEATVAEIAAVPT
jgi:hypothetical protein